MNPSEMPRDFKGIWIPREIWLNDDLLPNEKILWAEIHSLFDREHGGCHATNEYLAKFLRLKPLYVSQMISKLKKRGLIQDVHFDGRKRIIRAVMPPEKIEVNDKQHIATAIGSITPQLYPPIILENKEENIDIYASQAPQMCSKSPKSSSKKSKAQKPISERACDEEVLHYGEFESVLLTQAEYDRLLSDFGKDVVDETIDDMDLISADMKDKAFRKQYRINARTYYYALRRWIKRREAEGWNTKANEKPEKNAEWAAKKINELEFKAKEAKCAFHLGNNYLEIHPTEGPRQPTQVQFEDKDFKKKVEAMLHHWRIIH